jgi:hypothetical protein
MTPLEMELARKSSQSTVRHVKEYLHDLNDKKMCYECPGFFIKNISTFQVLGRGANKEHKDSKLKRANSYICFFHSLCLVL